MHKLQENVNCMQYDISMNFAGVRLYQGVLNRAIPNYAMIAARDFGDRDSGSDREELGNAGRLDGLNDGLWCQSAMNASDIGTWKFPNGNIVPDDLNANPIHMEKQTWSSGIATFS